LLPVNHRRAALMIRQSVVGKTVTKAGATGNAASGITAVAS